MRPARVLVTAIAVVGALAVGTPPTAALAGTAVPQVRPRPGQYTGQEATGSQPQPVSFTVTANGGKVRDFTAEGVVRTGCPNHIVGFQAPTGPMPVTRGHFHGVETNYPQRGVRVRVVGTFTSRVKARGRIIVRIAHEKSCDASRRFRVRRKSPSPA
jgi:hypothetical protein